MISILTQFHFAHASADADAPCPNAMKRAKKTEDAPPSALPVHIFSTSDIFGPDAARALREEVLALPFLRGEAKPAGGFLTNVPRRNVLALGDGSAIGDDGAMVPGSARFGTTWWTAGINQSAVSLESRTLPMPPRLAELAGGARSRCRALDPSFEPDDCSFVVAVVNEYAVPSDDIKPHTDDNPWYPGAAHFLSLTYYPDGQPPPGNLSRFQIKSEEKWVGVDLPDGSLCLMSGRVGHRVMAHKRSMVFRRRINVTMRCLYRPDANPVLHAMAVANHSRYYGTPLRLVFPRGADPERVSGFYKGATVVVSEEDASDRTAQRRRLVEILRRRCRFRVGNNMVVELLRAVLQLEQK